MDWKERFYWPSSREYAVPWLVGPAVFFVLAAFGIAGGKPPTIGPLPHTIAGYLLVSVLLLVFNSVLFWTHVRPQFLTWRIARRPFLGTYLLLNLAYLAIWALTVIAGDAAFTLTDADPVLILENMALGFAGLTPALLASALWKTEEPGVSNLRVARNNAKRLLHKTVEGSLEEREYPALRRSLASIATDSEPLLGRLRLRQEFQLLNGWKKAAARATTELDGKAYHDLSVSKDLGALLKSTLAELTKDS